jgi:Phosphatidylethanolamine-binding protein
LPQPGEGAVRSVPEWGSRHEVPRVPRAATVALIVGCLISGVWACGATRVGTPIPSLEVVDFDHLMIGCASSGIPERILWHASDPKATAAISSAKTVAVQLVDDISSGTPHVYWMAYGIRPDAPWFFPGSAPYNGLNTDGVVGYTAPCPPPTGVHWYRWQVMALDAVPNLKAGFSKSAFDAAVSGHVLAQGNLRTQYQNASP